ncbi:MerR family transcriptional regulator [Cytobacillus sp.]|uniref:helix-turn-helix domain-containing protein n=1 Tax=Cytobacillus sp. TaxID=2675269 RepID=UPI0028BD38E7|nr:MerR family transcriptional regulator [Cytobacillus sp.]
MSKLMTIQEFSVRTGISKSALRYYESKNLLRPAGRDSSGYRVYSENQVAIIKLISSLRLADVPIKDIQAYLKEKDKNRRKNMMDHWMEMIRKRLDILKVSLRYLESDSIEDQMYLIEKADENIIWFSAESETGKFSEHFIKRGKELEKLNIPIKSGYLKYLSGKDLIKAHIGFGVPFGIQTGGLSEVESVELLPSSIYIAFSFNEPISEIQNGYWKLINYAKDHKWIPTGSILEWYRGDDFSELDLLMPVTKLETERI